jgi:hypothetical protein
MNIATKIWDSGWGAVFLTIYTAIFLHLLAPDKLLLKLSIPMPAVLIMFFADRYNNRLVRFFAGGELLRSAEVIEDMTGEQDFYESADEELQSRINKLDRRAYQNNVSILAGIVIAVLTPVIGLYQEGGFGLLVGIIIAALALQLLTRRSIHQLNKLAQNLTKPYTAKYENQ